MNWIHSAGLALEFFASAEIILLAMIAIGAIPWNVSRRLGARIPPSIFVFFGVGATILMALIWQSFRFSLPTRGLFAALIALAILAAGWALVRLLRESNAGARRLAVRRLQQHARDFAVLSFFAACVSLWMGLLIRSGDVALISGGNNDIFAYAAGGSHLLQHPEAVERISSFNFYVLLKNDVFGPFALVAFSAFLLLSHPITIIQAPMIACCAMAAGAVFWICRRHLQLPSHLSVILGLVLLGNTLFQYSVIQYFLGQIFASAMLLIIIGTALGGLSAYGATVRWPHFFLVGVLIGGIRYIYAVTLILQVFSTLAVVALVLFFGSWAKSKHCPLGSTQTLRSLAVKLLLVVGMIALGTVIAAPDVFIMVSKKIRLYSQDNIVGFPFEFVGLLTLFNLPSRFISPGFSTQKVLEFIVMAGITAMAFAAIRAAKARLRPVYLSLACLFCLYILVYLIIYAKYGTSYQQWKFAASYPTILAFAVFACFAPPIAHLRKPIYSFMLMAFLLVISANTLASLVNWQKSILRMSRDFSTLSSIDTIADIDAVFIDLPLYSERMLAQNYIREKQLLFSGPTYWGSGDPVNRVDGNLAVLRRGEAGCDETLIRQLGSFRLLKADARVRVGARLSFAGSLPSCLQKSGLSDPEPWGTWSNSRTVSLTLDCACHDSSARLAVLLTVRPFLAPPAVIRQRVLISIDGGAPVRHELVRPEDSTLLLPIPPGEDRQIRIAIELPDAAVPSELGKSTDPRLLGIGLVSLELQRE